MKRSATVGLIVGIVGFFFVCGLCVIFALIFYVHSNRVKAISQAKDQEVRAQVFGDAQAREQEAREQTQAIVNVINENNRDLQELQSVMNSNQTAVARVHAMTIEVPAMTAKLRAIDTSKCPEDFQQAYLRYCQAWEGMGQKLSQLPQTNSQLLSETLASVLTKSPNPIAKQGDQLSNQSDALRLAWNDVEAVALRFKVAIK